jgi:hypothetical protein
VPITTTPLVFACRPCLYARRSCDADSGNDFVGVLDHAGLAAGCVLALPPDVSRLNYSGGNSELNMRPEDRHAPSGRRRSRFAPQSFAQLSGARLSRRLRPARRRNSRCPGTSSGGIRRNRIWQVTSKPLRRVLLWPNVIALAANERVWDQTCYRSVASPSTMLCSLTLAPDDRRVWGSAGFEATSPDSCAGKRSRLAGTRRHSGHRNRRDRWSLVQTTNVGSPISTNDAQCIIAAWTSSLTGDEKDSGSTRSRLSRRTA